MDLSKLSTEDLVALKSGDLSKVSTEGLMLLKGQEVGAGGTVEPQLTQEQIAKQKKAAALSFLRGQRSPMQNVAADIVAGASSVGSGIFNLPSKLFDAPWLQSELSAESLGADPKSAAYLAGSVADPMAMAIGGTAMKGASKAVEAIPKMASNQIVKGMLGGAAGGAAVGALSEGSDAATGGLFGGVIGGILPGAAKLGGYAYDRLKGVVPDIRAADILRKVYGDDLAQARTLWGMSPSNVTATQAAAPTGNVMGAALGERAATYRPQVFSDIAEQQAAARRAAVSQVAGGQTQTAAKVARDTAKDRLNAVTGPMREQELDAANTAQRYLRDLSERAKQKGESLVSALQNQWKLSTDEAQAMARFAEGKPGWLSNADYADEARQASDIFSRIRGQRLGEKDFLEYQARSLAAHGLKPIDTNAIVSGIQAKLADPKLAGNSVSQYAMNKVSESIKDWTAQGGGVIDAQALYSIRKNAVQSAIQDKLSGLDPKAQSKAAAGALAAIEPLIDDAIIKAGGTGWKDYLSTYARGMTEVNRMKLGAKAMDMLDNNPKAFMKLVENNSPDIVQKIFKSKSGVVDAMGANYWPLAKAGGELRRDAELLERATKGRTALGEVLGESTARAWLPKLIDWKLALAREAGDVLEGQLNKATMNKLYMAMRSGKSANELLDMVPARERSAFLNLFYSGGATPYTMGGAVAVGTGEQP